MATYRNSANDTSISCKNTSNNVYNTGNNVTIYGGGHWSDSNDYINNSGSNVVIYAYTGKDEVVNFGDNTRIDTGDGDDNVTNRGKNVTIYSGAGKDTITTYGDNSQVSLGADSNSVNAYANNVIIKVSHGHQTIQSKAGSGTYIEGSDSDEKITIQQNGSGSGVVATVKGGGGNDTFYGSAGAEVFEYTGTDGNDVIYNWGSNDQILLTSGSVDDSMINDDGDVVLNIGYSSITIKDASDKRINITSGNIPNTQPSTNDTSVTLASTFTGTYESDDEVIKIDASKVKSAIEIYGNDNNNSITGSSKNDTIYGGNGKDLIKGGNGNDFLAGESGNDTLTGGAGADIFYFDSNEGTDTITDYSASQGDKIQLGVSSMTTSKSGNNLILKVGTGKITVKNGNKSAVSVVGANGNTTVVGGSSTVSTLPSGLSYANNKKTLNVTSFTKTLDLSKYASTVTTVDASTNKKFVTIKGTSRNELIKAGKAGSNLIGGTGNDTLYGGSGADTFTYSNGDGKDLIYNYTSYVDTIYVKSGTISKASISGSDVVLSVGSGSITIKNAKSKDINITDSSGETGTYNFTKTVTNPTKSYEERNYWFEDNAECRMQNDELESILVETNDLIVDALTFNDQINSQEKITSLTYTQQKKK